MDVRQLYPRFLGPGQSGSRSGTVDQGIYGFVLFQRQFPSDSCAVYDLRQPITQIAHNVAVIIVAAPIVWNLSQTAGFNPVGFYLLVILSAGIAFVTPAASIIGAISFSNGEWIGVQRAFKVGFIGNFICLGCLIALGLPLVLLLVGI